MSRIDEEKAVSQIIENVHVLRPISWLHGPNSMEKRMAPGTIKQCFENMVWTLTTAQI